MIKKVKSLIKKENFPTQNDNTLKLGVPLDTLSKIIYKDLKCKKY